MTNTLQESLLGTGKTSSERQSNRVANVVKPAADFWAQYGFLPIFLTAMLLGVSNAAEAEERVRSVPAVRAPGRYEEEGEVPADLALCPAP